jgi:flavin-dependent dehydrogenase
LIESYSYAGYAYSPSLRYRAFIKKDDPIVGMTLREKFDSRLVQLAVDDGANFIDGKKVEDIKISKEKAKIVLDDKQEVDTKLVVATDGVWSVIGNKLNLIPKKGRRIGVCLFQQYNLGEETIDKFFGDEKACSIHLRFQGLLGYGWVFPKKQHLNIGVGKISPDDELSKSKTNLSQVYKEYIKVLKKTNIIPDDLKIGRCKGGALHIGPLRKTYSERVLLCGDAAGFINPLTGEGIYYAMSSGKTAADVIVESLEKEDVSETFLSSYQTKWMNDFGKDIYEFLRLPAYRGNVEYLVKLASKNDKLADIMLGVVHGGLNFRDYKLELIIRFLIAHYRERLANCLTS